MIIVEGAISVKAVLKSRYRKVNKIYISYEKNSSDVSFIISTAKKSNITVERCAPSLIESLAKGKTHGGIIAEVSERKMQTVSSLLYKEKPFIGYIEGVEDSYNFGYILRTFYAMGADGLILKDHYFDFEDSNIIKSSAGASELMPIVYVSDIESTLSILKNNNVKVVSAYRGNGAVDVYKYDFTTSGTLMCIGGPLRGLSKPVLDNSDAFIYIPYANDFRNALNASSASALLAGEIYRQNHSGE